MSWSIGYDSNHKRDIGYGVPAICDHPDCNNEIDRGLSYVCGSEPYGGEHGCGLYFCGKHREFTEIPVCDDPDVEGDYANLCERCLKGEEHFPLKPDAQVWREWKRTDESWTRWRTENPEEAAKLIDGSSE